jgi:hypothetical protein
VATLNCISSKCYKFKKKTHELLSHLYPDLPQVICLMEHHLNTMEINLVNTENYITGAQFCRALYGKGVVAIYVHKSLKFTNTDLRKYCKEKDIEICAVKLNLGSTTMCIKSLYRSPLGNFNYFLQSLNNVLQSLYTPVSRIICGDININYLVGNKQREKFDNILLICLSCFHSTSFKYLTRNQFLLDSTHLYILHGVLLLICSVSYLLFLLCIYGMLNKITITITHTCHIFPLTNKFTMPVVHSVV